MRRYTVVLTADVQEGGYSVEVPALPGCFTQGETVDEALAMAKDTIQVYLAGLRHDGDPIPDEPGTPLVIVASVQVEDSVATERAEAEAARP